MTLWPQQWEFVGTWVGAWCALYLLSSCCGLIALVATGLLAVVLADLSLKVYDVFLHKRENIKDVRKKAVLITGCDSGFGLQLSNRLLTLGFYVYAGCLSEDSDGAKQLSETGRTRVLKMDVTKQEDLDEAFKIIRDDLKANGLELWSIVNNAGIAVLGEVEMVTTSTYRQVLEVNTFAAVMVTKTFLPLLRAAGRGRIVSVSSQAGRFTMYGFTPYSMSKYALISFSDGLRLEMKKWNITVHTVEPGLYRTPIVDEDTARARFARVWEAAGEEAQEAYGKDYFDAVTEASLRSLATARPSEKVVEVIDDLVDAVAGTRPKIRYIPATPTKIWQRALHQLPFEFSDRFWLKFASTAVPRALRKSN